MWLVRHGETEWSRSGRHTSVSDIALTESGEAEARDLRERLAAVSFELVLTSPRIRARHTAELAGFPDAEVTEDLAEWDYGELEGLTTDVIQERDPGLVDLVAWRPGRRERRGHRGADGPPGRPVTGSRGPGALLRPRPRTARAGGPMAGPARGHGWRRWRWTPRPSPCSAASTSGPRSSSGTAERRQGIGSATMGVCAPVAQWIERHRPKVRVGGSSPSGGATVTATRSRRTAPPVRSATSR